MDAKVEVTRLASTESTSNHFISGNETFQNYIAESLISYHSHLMLFVIVWIIVVVHGTIFQNSKCSLLSIKRSINDLKYVEKSHLSALDIFRVSAIVWVITNHTGSEGRIDILEGLPSAAKFKAAIHNHPILGALLGNSGLGVDIFSVLSGFLAALSWLHLEQKSFGHHYALTVVKRWLRIFPSLAVFIVISSSGFIRRILPRFHTSIVSSCGLSGTASHLMFFANWMETPTCYGYLWYLSLDMQLYIAAPFLFHLCYKNIRKAVKLALILVVCSIMCRAGYCIYSNVCDRSDVDIPFISYDQDHIVSKDQYAGVWEIYSRPIFKCGPFLIGFIMARIWFLRPAIAEQTLFRLFILSSLAATASIYGILPQYWQPNQGSTFYNIIYTATFQTIFASSIGLMMLTSSYLINRNQLSTIWPILARLTFSVYLVHMPIVFIFNHFQILQVTTNPYILIAVVPVVTFLSFNVALAFYIMFESPLARLSTTALRKLSQTFK